MCGVCGIVQLDTDAPPIDQRELAKIRDAMLARGPDGEGLWVAGHGRVALGHRRLAIIDLSSAGLQPQSRSDGRLRITYNGEIYNYRELRAELEAEGVRFKTQSDTEVILALYERRGEQMFNSLRGMYALAIWDDSDQTLLLARDPYGIKPLYYSVFGGALRFASQVKALLAGGAVPDDVDNAALAGFLLWGSVPEPLTIRRSIAALPAGHYLKVSSGRVGTPVAHYTMSSLPGGEASDPATALEDSVRAHLVSDVPVVVFLSAGMDSTLIAALAARSAKQPITTLTLAFDEYSGTPFDEAPLAREVARSLGTEHIEHSVERKAFVDLWPTVMGAMDQPSIDGFNTFVVSAVARQHGFKVALSGIGGDEMFGGYPSFSEVPKWERWSRTARRVPGLAPIWPSLARRLRPEQPKLPGLLRYGGSLPGAYFLRRGLFLPEEVSALLGRDAADAALGRYDPLADAGKCLGDAPPDAWEAVHLMESTQYMRNQLLRDSDWASMAQSLELRTPLVDHVLRSAVAAGGYQPGRSAGKAQVVRSAAPELPAALWTRPKSGFRIPVMEWVGKAKSVRSARGPAVRALALDVLREFGIEPAPSRGDLDRLL